ncbi:hypothetical protein F511_15172 [Dorcoceras hygrometricum]|uniref:Uncharacterized protein n=1 Tax=Dorcoceras hygrometricum TaxID=472368 RepID=A0A2Z7BG30_9LAMI|nr:hypothetical protein F511_15172 [Dorcoceras hygrometricum]
MFPNKAILHLVVWFVLLFHVASMVTAARDLGVSSSISNMEVKGGSNLLDGNYISPPPPECKIMIPHSHLGPRGPSSSLKALTHATKVESHPRTMQEVIENISRGPEDYARSDQALTHATKVESHPRTMQEVIENISRGPEDYARSDREYLPRTLSRRGEESNMAMSNEIQRRFEKTVYVVDIHLHLKELYGENSRTERFTTVKELMTSRCAMGLRSASMGFV